MRPRRVRTVRSKCRPDLDVREQGLSLAEGRMGRARALPEQLVVGPLDILTFEGNVIKFVPVSVRPFEIRRTFRIPVQLQHLFRPRASQLRPFAPRLRDATPTDECIPRTSQ